MGEGGEVSGGGEKAQELSWVRVLEVELGEKVIGDLLGDRWRQGAPVRSGNAMGKGRDSPCVWGSDMC